MRERWLRIGVVAGVLFAINLVGRLVIRLGSIEDVDRQQVATLLAFGVIALVMAGLTGWWSRLRPLGHVTGELAAAGVAAGVLILTVGPFVNSTSPAAIGAGDTFNAAWQYAAFAAGGAVLGMLVIIALGMDHTSQSLRRYAQARQTKPPRPVRVRR